MKTDQMTLIERVEKVVDYISKAPIVTGSDEELKEIEEIWEWYHRRFPKLLLTALKEIDDMANRRKGSHYNTLQAYEFAREIQCLLSSQFPPITGHTPIMKIRDEFIEWAKRANEALGALEEDSHD